MSKGFANIGNTCYLNSALQLLMHNIDFCNKIIKYIKSPSVLLSTFGTFVSEYHNNVTTTLNPKEIKTLVESQQQMFMGYNQHDAGEFIIFLLSMIDDEMKKCGEMNGLSTFNIKSNVRIKCKRMLCLNINNNIDNNTYLLLDLKTNVNKLDDVYQGLKSGEILDGDNMYNCSKCNTKTVASKRLSIIEWPNNLIIILKRFTQDGNRLQKNNQQIEIPLVWRKNYYLYSAIIHSGNLNGGHYTSVGLKDNVWYHYNDSNVSRVNNNDIQNYINNAYILYYNLLS